MDKLKLAENPNTPQELLQVLAIDNQKSVPPFDLGTMWSIVRLSSDPQ
jgi:hypothetical protein